MAYANENARKIRALRDELCSVIETRADFTPVWARLQDIAADPGSMPGERFLASEADRIMQEHHVTVDRAYQALEEFAIDATVASIVNGWACSSLLNRA